MTVEEVIKELELLLQSIKIELIMSPNSKKVKKQKEVIEIAIENIKILEALKNSLNIIYTPILVPKLKDDMPISDYLTLVTEYAFEVEQRKRNQKITDALTKWIIKNIDKDKVRKWLNND